MKENLIHFLKLKIPMFQKLLITRLFFNDYINNIEDFETITYVDCDMICLKDPFITISEHSKNLIESEYVLAARKEKFETIEMEKIIKKSSTKLF